MRPPGEDLPDPPAGMLQAILDDPDDDARRLVTADWLEENGWAPQCARAVRAPGFYHLQLARLAGQKDYLRWVTGATSVCLGELPTLPLCPCGRRATSVPRERPRRWLCRECFLNFHPEVTAP